MRIRRIGICGTDLHAYQGNQPFITYPRIFGHELAGEIDSIEDNPYDLKPGDPVVMVPYLECGKCIACRMGKTNCCTQLKVLGVHSDGGMRQWMLVPSDHLIKAESLDLDQVALVECMAIGAHAVRRAEIQPNEYVLIIGAGPIGLGTMQFAKADGAKVIVMVINDQRLLFSKIAPGADFTVNAGTDPEEALSN